MPTKTKTGNPTMPAYVRKNLEFFLAHEHEDPEMYGKKILDLSNRWGF